MPEDPQPESTILTVPDITLRLAPRDIFPNQERRLEVDVGCGKGKFLLARARSNPDVDFLGIDRLLRRLRLVDRRVQRAHLTNVRLLRMEAAYAVNYLLPPDSVSTFYVFFPDPWPKRRHLPKRLFNDRFLASIHAAMKSDGEIHISTDNLDYSSWIARVFAADQRFEPIPPLVPSEEERTDFETVFLGQSLPINRLAFRKH